MTNIQRNNIAAKTLIGFYIAIILWTTIIASTFYYARNSHEYYAEQVAMAQINTTQNKDVSLQKWITQAGAQLNDAETIIYTLLWIAGIICILILQHLFNQRISVETNYMTTLEHNANHDSLTGSPNRSLLNTRVNNAITQAKNDENYSFALCFIDLDRFKHINDTYGHQVGDYILIELVNRITPIIRSTDTLARIGGDEFVLLLSSDRGDEFGISELVKRVHATCAKEYIYNDLVLKVYSSIGIIHGNQDSSFTELLRDADIAMYRAKALGSRTGGIVTFNDAMYETIKDVSIIEQSLSSIDLNEFEIVYQPIYNARTNSICGFEALSRWKHPVLGYISPDVFIPIAEQIGVIGTIDKSVLSAATKQITEWNNKYDLDLYVSINMSASHISNSALVQDIDTVIKATGIKPNNLVCEITETALIKDLYLAQANIKRIKHLGVKISADDFGKGYSSLTYLKDFNFDVLKIDKQFIDNIADPTLVDIFIELGHKLDMKVVAEGVEEKEQYEELLALGCDYIQGYYFSKPLTPNDANALLA